MEVECSAIACFLEPGLPPHVLSFDDACVIDDDAGTTEQVSQADCLVRETALRARVLEDGARR